MHTRREAMGGMLGALAAGTLGAGVAGAGAGKARAAGGVGAPPAGGAGPAGGTTPGGAGAERTTAARGRRLRVMSYNIWVGGTRGGPTEEASVAQTVEVMRAADADVVLMQEQGGRAEWYAQQLGWRVLVQGGSTAILTRHAIGEHSANKWGARVDLEGGGSVWAFNVHFPAAPYQPYQLMGIEYHGGRFVSTAADAMTEARLARGEPALRCLRDMQPALRSGLPVFLGGDFNEPSHLDWTPEAVRARGLPVSVEWPTTRMFHDAGFEDCFRAAHPDPVRTPGYTWTPRPDTRDVMDRIDLVLWAGGGVRVRGAEVMGERGEQTQRVVEPWPSDHRAVVGEFEV